MLCNGLSRDPDGRTTLAEVYGLPLLAELLSSSAPKVQLCGAAVLSLYSRTAKVSPRMSSEWPFGSPRTRGPRVNSGNSFQ